MKQLIILFCAVALASTSQLQSLNSTEGDFVQGINAGLGLIAGSTDFLNCEASFNGAFYSTFELLEYFIEDWDVDFKFMTFQAKMTKTWKSLCEPVASAYGKHFALAIEAFNQDKALFFATLEENFEENEVEVIETILNVVSLIKSGDSFQAGEDFASVLKILLSTWTSKSE